MRGGESARDRNVSASIAAVGRGCCNFFARQRIKDRKATIQTDGLWNATGNSGRGAEP